MPPWSAEVRRLDAADPTLGAPRYPSPAKRPRHSHGRLTRYRAAHARSSDTCCVFVTSISVAPPISLLCAESEQGDREHYPRELDAPRASQTTESSEQRSSNAAPDALAVRGVSDLSGGGRPTAEASAERASRSWNVANAARAQAAQR
jgi:hypothetical protein